MTTMASLVDVRQDISSLETEISQLEEQYKNYALQLEELKHNRSIKTTESAVEETIQTTNSPQQGNNNTPYDDIIVPPPLEHDFFDVAVIDFFESRKFEEGYTSKKQKVLSKDDWENSELQKKEILSHINLENLYRLNGVTAFAINDPSVNGDSKLKDLRQLGIRFDLFDKKTQTFKKPHYIILRKNDKNDNWEIFKKTIPEYVDMDLKWLNLDLYKFTSRVRSQLLRLSAVDLLSGILILRGD